MPWRNLYRQRSASSIRRFAYLSIGAALLTVALKIGAYYLTGSVGLLSDALESLVNLAGAVMTLAMLIVAERPPDEEHAFGHSKAEYFSSGFEGGLIFVAAFTIIGAALPRLLDPQPLEQVGIGLLDRGPGLGSKSGRRSGVATWRQTLRLDCSWKPTAITCMTDVWTSVGVVVGIAAVMVTGWYWLDPVVALIVAANIIRVGVRIMRQSVRGLMDAALPADELETVQDVLRAYEEQGVEFHALRTRQAGPSSIRDGARPHARGLDSPPRPSVAGAA